MAHFFLKTRVFWGKGANAQALHFLKESSLERSAFLVDSKIENLKVFLELLDSFKKAKFRIRNVEPFDASDEPTYAALDKCVERFRKKDIDFLVGIGGGSVMDVAKGAGILLRNPGKAIKYRGSDKVNKPGIPVVCYPATAGTGSEVTHTASFIDQDTKTKLGINGKNVSAFLAVLLPELSFSCPQKVTISSGLDAILHAIEAVSAKNANEISIMLGSQAFLLLYKNFKKVLWEPENYKARQAMLLGSYYAGIAMMNAGGGPASGISYPLGVHFKVPHGIAGGIFLPHVFAFNVAKGYLGYSPVYACLPDANLYLSNEGRSQDFVVKFQLFYKQIKAPLNLYEYGVVKSKIEFLTDLTIQQRTQNLEFNPVPFGRKEVIQLLEKVVTGD
jgi:alcohol dehydrogenase